MCQEHPYVKEVLTGRDSELQLFRVIQQLGQDGTSAHFYDTVAFHFAATVLCATIYVWVMRFSEDSHQFVLDTTPSVFQPMPPATSAVTWHIINYDARHSPVRVAEHYEAVWPKYVFVLVVACSMSINTMG
jgi:hypothetical protein